MADADLPDAEATGPLKPIRPPSPQKTNSNTHNAVEDGAMAHSGSVKRVRSLDEDRDEQDPTSNSASSPKRARLNDDDQTSNCKDPNVNNKDHSNEDAAVSSNGDDSSSNKKEEHLNSNGDLDGTDSPANQSKDSSKAPSIDGANDAGESKGVEDKDENSQNSTVDGDSNPKNGPPSEPSKEAEAASLDADKEAPSSDKDKDVASSENDKDVASSDKDKEAASSDKDKEAASSDKDKEASSSDKDKESASADKDKEKEALSSDKDKEASESSVSSTLTESNSEDRTASPGNDKLCDSNAKENDTDGSKKEGDKDESIKEGDKEDEEKMEVDGEDAKDSKQDSAKPTNGVDSIDKEDDKMDTTAKEESKDKLKDGKKEDDIIDLSDDNKDATNQSDNSSRPLTPIPEPSNPLDNLSEEQVKARDELIKKLNEELRNEEAKLLLLKKLRQSQQQPVVAEPKPETSSDDPVKLIGQNHNAAAPPPLFHGPGSLKPQLSSQASELVRQQRLMPQLIRGGNLQQAHGLHGNIQGGPPPLVLARGGNLGTLHQQQQHQRNQMMRMITTGNITHTTSSTLNSAQHARVSSTSNSVQETQSAASRQAAAKLALRKQLEKTLLQIPPPKPPPPELHFLPSAANNEFIILVGLEEVVNTILDIEQKDKSKKEPKYIAPFRCAQCKTDFTTIWKQGSKQGIMCENCIVSNQKRALKAEHTNRLKTAFVKALQQEQEIEQRMQQSHSAASSGTSLNIPRVTHKVRQVPQAHSSHQSLLQSAAHHGVQVIQQPNQRQRVLNPAPPQRTMQPVTYAYIPQVGGVNIAGIQMIPKQQFVTGHPAMVTATDRQREYLLDMISNKSGSSLSSMSWKR